MGMRSLGLLVLSGVLAVVFLCPSVSSAGHYEVSACTEAVDFVNNSWEAYSNDQTHIAVHSACDEPPAVALSGEMANLAIGDLLGASSEASVGSEAGWRFNALPGTKISEVTGYDGLLSLDMESWIPTLREADGNILPGEICVKRPGESYCSVGGPFGFPGLNTSSLSIGVSCPINIYNNCPNGSTLHDVRAELDYATVTIEDELAPTGVTDSQVPVGPQHGTITIPGSAVDETAGLLSLSVVNGAGEVVGGPVAVPGTCNYSFTTPCPTKVEGLAIPLDTTKLPNGEDQLRVEATNAAHDEGFSSRYAIDVENSSPKQHGGGGGSPSEGGSKTGGSGGSNFPTGGTGGTSGSGTSTGGSTAVPIPVSIHLDKVRRAVSSLLISGHLQPALTGTVTLMLWHTGSRELIRNLHLHVTKGRFGARIPLGRRQRRRHLTVDVSYPGGAVYLHASRTQIVSPVGLLLR